MEMGRIGAAFSNKAETAMHTWGMVKVLKWSKS